MNTKLNLSVIIMKEGRNFIAYSPALDLSTSGKTLKDVEQNFSEAVNLFFDELKEMDTVDEVLTSLGWTKANKELVPPAIIASQTQSFSIPLTC